MFKLSSHQFSRKPVSAALPGVVVLRAYPEPRHRPLLVRLQPSVPAADATPAPSANLPEPPEVAVARPKGSKEAAQDGAGPSLRRGRRAASGSGAAAGGTESQIHCDRDRERWGCWGTLWPSLRYYLVRGRG